MKTILIPFLTVASVALLLLEANARVTFQEPLEFAGTGCQPHSYTFSGQGTDTLTVLFSAYDAAQPKENAASGMQHTSCSFAVPLRVPAGYQVSTMTADWRGYAEGGTELFREYFFAGELGSRITSTPSGEFVERDNELEYDTFSQCGEDVILRINSSVNAVENESYIALDSIDIQNTLEVHIRWQRCGRTPLSAILPLLL